MTTIDTDSTSTAIDESTVDGEVGVHVDDVVKQTVALNPYLNIVQCSQDEFLVKHGTRSPYSTVIRDEGRTGLMGRVLGELRSPGSLDELLRRGLITEDELEPATKLVHDMLDRGVLTDPAQDLTRIYVQTLLGAKQSGTGLSDKVIGIVDCGQLGSRIATELALLRPKALVLHDPRATSPMDHVYLGASREFDSRQARLGKLLADRGMPPDQVLDVSATDLTDETALAEVCERSDFVVLAAETYSPTLLHAMNELAIRQRTNWMSVFVDGSEIVIGPTYVPGETCCYHEFETQAQASLRYKAEHLVFKEYLRDNALDGEAFVLPPYAAVAAGFAVTSVLRFLVKGETFTTGRAIRLNFETLSIDLQDVLKLPRCPACGEGRPTYRNLFL